MKKLLLIAMVTSAMVLSPACNSPKESGVKVIVGAKLIAAPGRTPVEYSVVVIDGTKFREVGPQSSTPVPKGAEMTRGIGMTVESAPGGGPIESGQPAKFRPGHELGLDPRPAGRGHKVLVITGLAAQNQALDVLRRGP